MIAVDYGFNVLCDVRSIIRLTAILINAVIIYIVLRISFSSMIKNIMPSIVAAIVMSGFVLLIHANTNDSIILQIVFCGISAAIYFIILLLFPKERDIVFNLKKYLVRK